MRQGVFAGIRFVAIGMALLSTPLAAAKKAAATQTPTLDQHVQEVRERSRQSSSATPGSLYFSAGRLADSVRDVRASQVYDLVTIVVLDNSRRFHRRYQHSSQVERSRGCHFPSRAEEPDRRTREFGQCIQQYATARARYHQPRDHHLHQRDRRGHRRAAQRQSGAQRTEGYLGKRGKTSHHDSGHRTTGGPQPSERSAFGPRGKNGNLSERERCGQRRRQAAVRALSALAGADSVLKS